MGGGSSSSDSSQSTTTENYNFQGIEGPAVTGSGNTINMTGDRAFEFAEGFGGKVVDMQGKAVSELFDTVQKLNSSSLQTLATHSKSAMDIAERTTRSDQTVMFNTMTKYMGAGFVVLMLVILLANYHANKVGKK